MDEQKQDDQLEPIYNSSVPIWDVAWKTSRERWTIETGGEGGQEVLCWQHDMMMMMMMKDILVEEHKSYNLNHRKGR